MYTLMIMEIDVHVLILVAAALKWKRRRERRKSTHDKRSALPTIPVTYKEEQANTKQI